MVQRRRTCDLGKLRTLPISVDDSAGLDKCGSWKQSSTIEINKDALIGIMKTGVKKSYSKVGSHLLDLMWMPTKKQKAYTLTKRSQLLKKNKKNNNNNNKLINKNKSSHKNRKIHQTWNSKRKKWGFFFKDFDAPKICADVMYISDLTWDLSESYGHVYIDKRGVSSENGRARGSFLPYVLLINEG